MKTESIENNLIELYETIARMGDYPVNHTSLFRSVYQDRLIWPDMTYMCNGAGEMKDRDVAGLVNGIKDDTLSKTLILSERVLAGDTLSRLKNAGFMPVAQWTNMALEINNDRKILINAAPVPDEVDIVEVKSSQQLIDWVSIVGMVLFNNKPLAPDVFSTCIGKGVIKLYTAYYKEKPVSTVLLFPGVVAGVYMVATMPEYRKLGFGRALMNHVQKAASALGYHEIYLHATKDGLPFYHSLGYASHGRMILFYYKNC